VGFFEHSRDSFWKVFVLADIISIVIRVDLIGVELRLCISLTVEPLSTCTCNQLMVKIYV